MLLNVTKRTSSIPSSTSPHPQTCFLRPISREVVSDTATFSRTATSCRRKLHKHDGCKSVSAVKVVDTRHCAMHMTVALVVASPVCFVFVCRRGFATRHKPRFGINSPPLSLRGAHDSFWTRHISIHTRTHAQASRPTDLQRHMRHGKPCKDPSPFSKPWPHPSTKCVPSRTGSDNRRAL